MQDLTVKLYLPLSVGAVGQGDLNGRMFPTDFRLSQLTNNPFSDLTSSSNSNHNKQNRQDPPPDNPCTAHPKRGWGVKIRFTAPINIIQFILIGPFFF